MKLTIDEPLRQKIPERFEQSTGVEEYPESYFEAIDLAMNNIKSHFDQEI